MFTMYRPTSGGDPFIGNVVSLMHFDNIGAPGTFIDVIGNTWGLGAPPFDNAAQSGSDVLLGAGAGLFDLQDLINTTVAIPGLNGALTIEFALKSLTAGASGRHTVVTITNAGSSFLTVFVRPRASGVGLEILRDDGMQNGQLTDLAGTPPTQWNRFRYTQDATTGYLFINGALISSFALARTVADGTTLTIGGNQTATPSFLIDEFRITAGVCRSTDSYTVDASAFPDA